ncbi:hypothetical protein [Natronosalvus halobius]|uniref:DUF7857 domain-containing protein n=1 Tax=Natronosalvus halobius TaxID=2953746 RepID=UPI00209E785A|nr:hypothetical protein [Natronosalvus halobius]USZ71354.1 hypothetical protein NGM15_14925 [Natronosalvus halobius]
MVEVEATATTVSGVAFVCATVWNTYSTPQRVRVRSTVSGPTWPPRDGEGATAEWSNDEWTARLEPGRRRGFGFATPVSEAVDDAAAAERTLASDGSADLTGARTDVRTPDPIDARTDLEAALESPVELVSAERADGENGPARPDDVLASLAPWAPVGAVLDGGSGWDSDAARDSDRDPEPGHDTGAPPESADRSRATHSSRIPCPSRTTHLPRDPPEQ